MGEDGGRFENWEGVRVKRTMRYDGPAIIVQGTTDVHVNCSITSYPSPSGHEDWSGVFEDAQPRHVLAMNDDEHVLRLPNGQECKIMIGRITGGNVEQGEFEGLGVPPG